MLSVGGDAAVHRDAITGKVATSRCVLMGDLRHYRLLADKLEHQPGLAPLGRLIARTVSPPEETLTLRLCGKDYCWQDLPVIMGILNVTPDSFSDGGLWHDPDRALQHALAMTEDGVEIIDVGGESTRPGAAEADEQTEIAHVVPVIRKLAADLDIPLSVDTRKAAVAAEAIHAGGHIINDVSALTHDPDMLAVARDTGAGVVLMHMRGRPETMQQQTAYDSIVDEIFTYLVTRIEVCLAAGIDQRSIIVDPGIGFGKDLAGNLSLIKHIREFRSLGVPVLLAHSRKSFLGNLLDLPVTDREEATDAVTAWAAMEKTEMVRVHDVAHARRIRTVMNAIMDAS